MAFKQFRNAFAIWGSVIVGAGNTAGTIVFGEDLDTGLTRSAANHLATLTGDRLEGDPLNTAGGSALTGNGDVGIDGSLLYWRTGGSIFHVTAASVGSIAV
jgi:hypothetical protein